MKKFITFFLTLMMMISLAACDGESPSESSTPTGDDSDMKSEENSQVMLEVADRNERYMSRVDLAPGESTSGWMIYQRQADKSEITMHYYSGFVNVPPTLVFEFSV